MKTTLAFFALFFCLLIGCQNPSHSTYDLNQWMANDGKLKVLSTTAMIDDLVKEVGGEYIDHLPLMVGEIDPHSYELVKGDDEKIHRADIIFSNGLGLEHGASLRYRLKHHPFSIALGDEIYKQVPEDIINIDGQLDPHVWMDISLWARAVDPIVEALSEKDPLHQVNYRENGKVLKEHMLIVHEEQIKKMQKIPQERRFLVTSHDAFNYFTRAYLAQNNDWKKRCAAPEGLAPDGQLSSADIQRIINYICTYHVTVVFPESNVSKDALRKIVATCASKGEKIEIAHDPLYGDAMGAKGSGADTYLKMIQHDIDVLIKYWEKDASKTGY